MAENTGQTTNSGTGPDAETLRKEATAAEQKRLAALQATFPGEADFVLKQFAAGASVAEAQVAFRAILEERLAAAQKAGKEAAEAAQATRGIGANPIPHGEAATTTGGADFLTTARELAGERKISVTAAMQQIARQQPELHAAFVANAPRKPLRDAGKYRRV